MMRTRQWVSAASVAVFMVCAASLTALGADPAITALVNVHKVFIDPMPNDLDQYIRAEITKQFKSRLLVVTNEDAADSVLTGTGTERTGTGAAITGRYLGLHDNATGSISLVNRGDSSVLWAGEAGDRNMWLGFMARGGPRKVADRLVHDLKKEFDKADADAKKHR